jgi:hypothetical protein
MDFRVFGTWLAIGILFWIVGGWLQLRFNLPTEMLQQAKRQGLLLVVYPPKWVRRLCGLFFLQRDYWDRTALLIQLLGLFAIGWSVPISFAPSLWSPLFQFLSLGVAMVSSGMLIRKWREPINTSS